MPLCPWPVSFCMRGWQPPCQPGNCSHLAQHIISSPWNFVLSNSQCYLMLDTWMWREISAPWLCFSLSEVPVLHCVALCVSLEGKLLAEMRNIAVDRPLHVLLGDLWGLPVYIPLPSRFPFYPGDKAPSGSPTFTITHYDRILLFLFLPSTSSPILWKLPGGFYNLLFYPKAIQIYSMSFQSPYSSCVFLLLLHLPEGSHHSVIQMCLLDLFACQVWWLKKSLVVEPHLQYLEDMCSY